MAFSGNPLGVEPPESLAQVSPELYEYLRDLNKTLHENYTRQESGAATFSADLLLQRYARQEYPLGSEGRFVHQDFGVLRGFFVRFADAALGMATPVGWDKTQFGKGFVTKDFAKSESVLFVGFDLTDGPGEFGWVLSHGILPATLGVSGAASSRFLDWTADGMETTNVATGVRIAVAFSGGTAPIGSVILKSSNAADGATGVEDDLLAMLSQIATIEGNVATLDEEFQGVIPLQDEMLTIQQKLDRVSQSVTVVNRLIAEFSPDGVRLEQEQLLNATRQYFNITAGLADSVDGKLQSVTIYANATLMNRDIAKSWSDQSGIYSQVSSERAGEATLQAAESQVSATASFNYKEEALVYRDAAGNYAAEASTYASISASYGSGLGQIVLNPVFAIWPVADPLPASWSWWDTPVGGNALIRETYGTNQIRIKFDMLVPQVNFGISQAIADLAPGEYVMDADVELVSGAWTGAGISVDGFFNLNFATEKDINGVISSSQSGKRRFSKRFTWVGGVTTIYVLANWTGLGAATVKVLRWYGATIRPVDGAYLTNKADIVTEQVVRANADSAMAGQITTLNAYFAGFSGTVQSAITTEATARSNADAALTTQITTLTASYSNSNGLNSNAYFKAGTQDWTASSVQAITASPAYSYLRNIAGTGALVLSTQYLTVDTARKYRVHCRVSRETVAQIAYVGLRCYNSAGGLLGDVYVTGSGALVNGSIQYNHTFSGVGGVASAVGANFMTGTYSVQLVCYLNNSVVAGATSRLEEFWLEDATDALDAQAQVVTEASARSSADSAMATQITTLNAYFTGFSGTVQAAITSEATTRANADTAISSTVSTLSTTVGGHTATLTTYGTSISGLNAKYGVTIDVNGYITGWELNGTGSSGEMVIRADKFKISKSGVGSSSLFDLDSTGLKLAVPLFYGTQTLNGEAGGKRLRHGAGFGTSNDLILWFGPNSVTFGTETKANSTFALATDGLVYYGGTQLTSGGGAASQRIDFAPGTTSGSLVTGFTTTFNAAPGTLFTGGEYNIDSTPGASTCEFYIELVKADGVTVITLASGTVSATVADFGTSVSTGITEPEIWTFRIRLRRASGSVSNTVTVSGSWFYR